MASSSAIMVAVSAPSFFTSAMESESGSSSRRESGRAIASEVGSAASSGTVKSHVFSIVYPSRTFERADMPPAESASSTSASPSAYVPSTRLRGWLPSVASAYCVEPETSGTSPNARTKARKTAMIAERGRRAVMGPPMDVVPAIASVDRLQRGAAKAVGQARHSFAMRAVKR